MNYIRTYPDFHRAVISYFDPRWDFRSFLPFRQVCFNFCITTIIPTTAALSPLILTFPTRPLPGVHSEWNLSNLYSIALRVWALFYAWAQKIHPPRAWYRATLFFFVFIKAGQYFLTYPLIHVWKGSKQYRMRVRCSRLFRQGGSRARSYDFVSPTPPAYFLRIWKCAPSACAYAMFPPQKDSPRKINFLTIGKYLGRYFACATSTARYEVY